MERSVCAKGAGRRQMHNMMTKLAGGRGDRTTWHTPSGAGKDDLDKYLSNTKVDGARLVEVGGAKLTPIVQEEQFKEVKERKNVGFKWKLEEAK